MMLASSALMFCICRAMSRQYLQWQDNALGERAHVFSAFGFVHKITTFEKTAGYQALVQFSDADTATSARTALDGRSIPSYLLPEEVGQCSLKITYSAHTDLTVKFQSTGAGTILILTFLLLHQPLIVLVRCLWV